MAVRENVNLWCRIFQVGKYQVMVNRDGFNWKEGVFEVKISAFANGCKLSAILGDKDEDKSDMTFDYFTQEQAETFLYETVFPLVNNND